MKSPNWWWKGELGFYEFWLVDYLASFPSSFHGLKNFYGILLLNSFGSVHDGDPGATLCSNASNFIMRSSPLTTNLQNKNQFSNCSISQFKSLLLSSNGQTSNFASCLINTSSSQTTDQSVLTNLQQPGQIWSPDDQCSMRYGNGYGFCRVNNLTFLVSQKNLIY